MHAIGLSSWAVCAKLGRTNLPSNPDQITCKIQLKTTKILALQGVKAHSEMPWQPLGGLNLHKIGL